MDIKVSVVVPCYNVEKYVAQCVESICAQTLKEIEIICVNDGSKDGTLAILEDFQKKDGRIRIIDKANAGYGHTMNMGMAKASGKYIGIVESDDFIEPDMFEKLYEAAENNQLDIARCCYYHYRTSDNSNNKVANDFVPKNIVIKPVDNQAPFFQAPAIWVGLYKREWLEGNEIKFLETPGASYQDTSFAFKAYSCAERFMMLDYAGMHYRIDNENSSVNNPGKVFCVCDEYAEIKRFLSTRPEIKEKVKYLVPVLQNATYKWNYNRLTPDIRYPFLKAWSKEIKEYISAKELDWKRFSSRDKKHLFIIAYFSFLYANRKTSF